MSNPFPDAGDAMDGKPKKVYHAGTLAYTKAALAVLIFWLFWGDVCFTVMEAVTGPIMAFKFKNLGASNTEFGLILITIPSLIYTCLNPIISVRSDRFRSRWGRRIPFLVFSLPFVVIFLIAMAFGDRIGLWMAVHATFLRAIPPNQVAILTLGLLLVLFSFFNTFVNSTFWYLFNDVVPVPLLARFMSWFRTISMLSTSMYSFFIFPYSPTHSTEIFLSAALLYLTGFGLMCYFVREGEYPPPTSYVGGDTGPIAAIKSYGLETHAFPLYWYLWISTFLGRMGGGVAYTFNLYYLLAIGLSPKQIGAINGVLYIVGAVLTPFAGWLADRYHPIRVVLVGNIINTFMLTPLGLIWTFWHPSNSVVFWVVMLTNVALGGPSGAFGGMQDPPLLMRLFPRMQYGQFCSVNAVWCSMAGMIGGVLMGVYLDVLGHWVGKEQAYYYVPAWVLFFGIPSFYFLLKLYWNWKKLGGDKDYTPPTLTRSASRAQSALLAAEA
jgi:maltose/moltooligosaccharide transporter